MPTATKKTKQTAPPALKKPRQLRAPSYSSFKLQKRIKPLQPKLPSGYQLLRQSTRILLDYWKVILGIVAVYGILNALFIQSFTGASEIVTTKDLLDRAFGSGFEEVVTSASIFVYLLGASGNAASEAAGAYQVILTIMVSLALVWVLREAHAGNKLRIRDSFYQGMYPLVPFLLVLGVMLLQLIPLFIGLFLYNVATTQGVAVAAIEHAMWFVFLCMSALLSFYWISGSVFALYIACLPGMTPVRALRSARDLVRYRRWTVLRKIIFLPFIMLIVAALVIIPVIWFVAPIAPWLFFVMSMLILPLMHTYLYTLYRRLL